MVSLKNLISKGQSIVRIAAIAAVAVAAIVAAPGAVHPTHAQSPYLFNSFNSSGVTNGPQHPTTFTLSQWAIVTSIATYHWNGGQGAVPGTIGIHVISATPMTATNSFGPYNAFGQTGNSTADVDWIASTGNLALPPGTYQIQDSDPSTWSTNAQSGYQGFVRVFGSTTTAGPAPIPSQPSAPARVPSVPSVTVPSVPTVSAPTPAPAAPLSVTLSPVTLTTIVVNGQIEYTLTFSWTASGGTGPLQVTIEASDAGYSDYPVPSLINMPYPTVTTRSYNRFYAGLSPTITFHAVVTDSTGATAVSAEMALP